MYDSCPNGQQLRQLIFSAEAADRAQVVSKSKAAWLQVQCFLLVHTLQDPGAWQCTARLRSLSQARLTALARTDHEHREAQAKKWLAAVNISDILPLAASQDSDLDSALNKDEGVPKPPASGGQQTTLTSKWAGANSTKAPLHKPLPLEAPPPVPSHGPSPVLPAHHQPHNMNGHNENQDRNVIEIDMQDSPEQAPAGAAGFQTARVKLAADMRKQGRKLQPQDLSSGPMFPGSHGGFNAGVPRAGLTRGGGGQSRSNPNAAGGGGRRGQGFIPPFVNKALAAQEGAEEPSPFSPKTLEMLADPQTGELPEALQKLDPHILELVCAEVLDSGAGSVAWEDIAGQDPAKRLVQELIVWPMLNPHLFKGARAPPKGLLLFGPPGTGKTLLGKAIASNIRATFFNISASSLTSKWIGEGEKMVRTLFAVAGALQPAVIFIDEIDSILSARKSDGEHEASRRLKTEMLVQMEGCDPSSADRRVLLVGATNRPEELDEAARRRMPKQLYIPLPCADARRALLARHLGTHAGIVSALTAEDSDKLVMRTDGYSGSDMRALIQEACQGPVRDAVAQKGAAVAEIAESDLRPVVLRDFQVAARAQRASVEPAEVVRYEDYDRKHGAQYASDVMAAMDEEDW
ncbi:hypothetical protein WJX73_010857 [Symbiochloris irregularis]|uniref:AAA+ ATPase domain-containing protein n=1 Tax=Symbiochloris irregularis TaxID=706552 RepID=A0AAW1NKX6_9CHLO